MFEHPCTSTDCCLVSLTSVSQGWPHGQDPLAPTNNETSGVWCHVNSALAALQALATAFKSPPEAAAAFLSVHAVLQTSGGARMAPRQGSGGSGGGSSTSGNPLIDLLGGVWEAQHVIKSDQVGTIPERASQPGPESIKVQELRCRESGCVSCARARIGARTAAAILWGAHALQHSLMHHLGRDLCRAAVGTLIERSAWSNQRSPAGLHTLMQAYTLPDLKPEVGTKSGHGKDGICQPHQHGKLGILPWVRVFHTHPLQGT